MRSLLGMRCPRVAAACSPERGASPAAKLLFAVLSPAFRPLTRDPSGDYPHGDEIPRADHPPAVPQPGGFSDAPRRGRCAQFARELVGPVASATVGGGGACAVVAPRG